MWGKVQLFPVHLRHERIIPTRVGTSQILMFPRLLPEDHPHACGDKDVLYALNAKEIEPAATKRRGLGVETDSTSTGSKISIADFLDDVKNYYSDVLSVSVRIIPTRVGTSLPLLLPCVKRLNHPHACGDKLEVCYRSFPYLGSSPRVWGQGQRLKTGANGARIIPTRVGTSSCAPSSSCSHVDHPHACGDKI